MLGIILIDKPKGITSHDVVNQLRRRFQTRRVGHAGTLDPMATGLLVIAIGPATRFLQYLNLEPKVYVAEITFGKSTTTQDAEGETLVEHPVPPDLAQQISLHVPEFEGEIQQIPPMYSAVKMGGKALYTYARAGVELEREPRTVFIHDFEISDVSGQFARAKITCSGGTYVRTLAHDLGEAIGCGAHLSALNRTECGRFHIRDAVSFEEASAEHLIPLDQALKPLPMLQLNESQLAHIYQGRAIESSETQGHFIVLLNEASEVVSIARKTGDLLQPECVLLPLGAA